MKERGTGETDLGEKKQNNGLDDNAKNRNDDFSLVDIQFIEWTKNLKLKPIVENSVDIFYCHIKQTN